MSTLLVFDIDGTLIRNTTAAKHAFENAVRAVIGDGAEIPSVPMAGRTDLAILADILASLRPAPAAVQPHAVFGAYVPLLRDALRTDPGELCPGVDLLLPALGRRDDVWLALGTGNVEAGAWLKLAAQGIDGVFEIGGFGGLSHDRDVVIGAAIANARRHFDLRFSRVVIVGDTPHDVRSAQANGAHCLAVATGRYDAAALRAAGATITLADLSACADVLAAIDALPFDAA